MMEIRGLSKSFGGDQVLKDVDVDIRQGEIHGLIGPNGAGKSTLFNCITGMYRPDTGSIKLGDRSLIGMAPHRVCHLGISRTFQEIKVFPSLNALENVRVGELFGSGRRRGRKARTARECLEFVGLGEVTNVAVSGLNFLERRLAEVARALAPSPRLLLLDEPMAGLNPGETQAMLDIIRKIRGEGASVFWIEHKLDAVFDLCDRITVLEFGNKIADGSPGEVARDQTVIEAYIGPGVSNAKDL